MVVKSLILLIQVPGLHSQLSLQTLEDTSDGQSNWIPAMHVEALDSILGFQL